ncbi:MAG: hypothetical protein P8165_09475 [Deltaproteobacteria bacterium]
MADQQQAKKGVSVIAGVFLCVVGIIFFALGFTVFPVVGFLIGVVAIVCAIFFFVRARRVRT